MWGERTRRPPAQILSRIGPGGVAWTRGGVASRSVATYNPLSGFVIRQRLALTQEPLRWLKSRYPQPSLIGSPLPEDALWGRPSSGRPIASFMGSTESHVTSATTRAANLAPRPRRARAFDDARGGLPGPKQASGANESAARVQMAFTSKRV
jgi:hypothetical protein